MEQVTNFSAALLKSVEGDTVRAAFIADQAIRDMSDNANRFGTDLSTIQTAYAGFAKQQFQLLDNLKLGYSGTKEGMEQLLAEAEKLTGKEFDLLELLVLNPNKVYSRENLLNMVWGYEYPGDVRTVDVHVRRLREKIEKNPSEPRYVHTKWGVGYYYQG